MMFPVGRRKRPLVAAFPLALVLALWSDFATAWGQEAPAVEFYHDFRKPGLPAELSLHNDPDGEFCRFEPEGLRVTVPKAALHAPGVVGVRALQVLRGNFEVTATIELLNLEKPPSCSGAARSRSQNAPRRPPMTSAGVRAKIRSSGCRLPHRAVRGPAVLHGQHAGFRQR